jgi:hypothetical protein
MWEDAGAYFYVRTSRSLFFPSFLVLTNFL